MSHKHVQEQLEMARRNSAILAENYRNALAEVEEMYLQDLIDANHIVAELEMIQRKYEGNNDTNDGPGTV